MWTGERITRTNARGRHSYCPPFKALIVEHALKPSMSTAGLAMRNEVNANQLRRWAKLHRLREAGLCRRTSYTDLPGPMHRQECSKVVEILVNLTPIQAAFIAPIHVAAGSG